MLTPPTPEADTAPKRSEAVFIAEKLEQAKGGGWTREVTFTFEGEEYPYALFHPMARSEEDARRRLYGPKPTEELNAIFLRDVQLDMTRPH